jgi:hypothetical protein
LKVIVIPRSGLCVCENEQDGLVNALTFRIKAAHAKELSWRSVLDQFVCLGIRFSP